MRWFFSNLSRADYVLLGIVAVFVLWTAVGFVETMLWCSEALAHLLAWWLS